MSTAIDTIQIQKSKTFLGHPKGFAFIASTELWDRISFHGMQALLVLYMAEQLLLPGHVKNVIGFATFRSTVELITGPLSVQALATQIFGLYVGLVYFMPFIGGIIGDRLITRRQAIITGALSMSAGHFCLTFDQTFLLALLLLVAGAGLMRGNLVAQLDSVYDKNDRRRVEAFQIYAALVGLGAFIAPVVTGSVSTAYGWHYGFGLAGFGMLLGLSIYLSGQSHFPREIPHAKRAKKEKLSRDERRTILFLLSLLPFSTAFWTGQSQIWNTYNLWARDHVDLIVYGWSVPVPWLAGLDGLAPALLTPLVIVYWRHLARRNAEPSETMKLVSGCMIFSASLLWLSAGHYYWGEAKTPIAWAIFFHFASNLGAVCFVPTFINMLIGNAPSRMKATILGVNGASVALGSMIGGRLGALYEVISPADFWMIHAAIMAAGGAGIFLLGGFSKRYIHAKPSSTIPGTA